MDWDLKGGGGGAGGVCCIWGICKHGCVGKCLIFDKNDICWSARVGALQFSQLM